MWMQDSAVAVLEQFGSDIWIAAGPTATSLGFRYPTRMAIIRLSDGGLFLWSPVAVSPELRAQIDSLGKVRVLVTPNSLHHLFLQEWRAAYPDAVLYAAPGSRERCKDIAFDEDLGDGPARSSKCRCAAISSPQRWCSSIARVASFCSRT